jgi:hypothetical protein
MNTLVAAGFGCFACDPRAIQNSRLSQFWKRTRFCWLESGRLLMAARLLDSLQPHRPGRRSAHRPTYVVSFLCYFGVRKGKHVAATEELKADIVAAEAERRRPSCGKVFNFSGTRSGALGLVGPILGAS